MPSGPIPVRGSGREREGIYEDSFSGRIVKIADHASHSTELKLVKNRDYSVFISIIIIFRFLRFKSPLLPH